MRESELQFQHALNSVALIHDIRTILTAAPDGRAEGSKAVTSLVNRIGEILKQTQIALCQQSGGSWFLDCVSWLVTWLV